MKTAVKVTAIKCPSCKGTGKFGGDLFDAPCMWCNGKKKLQKDRAIQYSEHIWMLAGGGYICGDHDLKECRKMEAESSEVRAAFGIEPIRQRI